MSQQAFTRRVCRARRQASMVLGCDRRAPSREAKMKRNLAPLPLFLSSVVLACSPCAGFAPRSSFRPAAAPPRGTCSSSLPVGGSRGGVRRRAPWGAFMSTAEPFGAGPGAGVGTGAGGAAGTGAGAQPVAPAMATPAAPTTTVEPGAVVSAEWELDIYSRPVMKGGKKLWELLICDSTGKFRHVRQIPSNMVNSRELRKAVEEVIEAAPVRPTVIRFFRNAMFNMIDIALAEVDVGVRPCRTTYALYGWLEEREREVYPKMEGYTSNMKQPSIFDIRTPSALPDALRGEQYAFVGLPVSEFRKGNVAEENIGVGRLCPLDPSLPDDAMIPGLAIFTERSTALATWMTGLELAFMKANLKTRELALECGIDTQYLMARVDGEQRKEAQGFEEGKLAVGGYHFVAVQSEPDADDVAGFWLLKEVNTK